MVFGATRKFGRSRYHLAGSANPKSKSTAVKEARRIRAKGGQARVVKVKKGYHAYGR